MLPDTWDKLRYHPEQSRLWTAASRFIAVRAGRGGGKTTIVLRKLITKQAEKRKHREKGLYGFAAPTRDQAKRIAWSKLKGLISPQWRAGEPSESELVIKTIWNSEIHVVGFDKPQRIEGVQWDGFAVDESSDIKPLSVENSVLPALTSKHGFCWRLGVPKRGGIGGAEFKGLWEMPDWDCYEWGSQSIIGEDEAARLRRMLDPKDYREQVEGTALDAGGRAYYCFSKELNVRSGPLTEYDESRIIYVGSDFNVDPMAWVLCHVVDGQVCVFDELFLHDTNTRSTLDHLHAKYPNHKTGWVFMGDASSRARKSAATAATPSDYAAIAQSTLFKNKRIRYLKSNPPVKNRMASVNALTCNADGERRLFINPKCVHLIQDLAIRDLDELGQPVNADQYSGHSTDALGYVIHGLFPSQYTAPVPAKSKLQFNVVH